MRRRRREMIERGRAAKEAKRHHAFYLGARARRHGDTKNPFAPGSALAGCWASGWRYADEVAREGRKEPS